MQMNVYEHVACVACVALRRTWTMPRLRSNRPLARPSLAIPHPKPEQAAERKTTKVTLVRSKNRHMQTDVHGETNQSKLSSKTVT